MAKYSYPAVFEKEQEGGYSIYFPDIEGCYSQGETLPECVENAEDALCLMLYELERRGVPLPEPQNIRDIKVKEDDIVTLIACNTRFYKNYFEEKSVKINATIPLWLKEAGEKKNVNFSQILQQGLKQYLEIS
ncbi:MAG: type II toxin-antitoxin system HicB family antitoxin [Oscillospiraceae bacterium]|nr:type II toxin-antitoxin system HicB family antitoxin [Oscillospiraceae bacterium]